MTIEYIDATWRTLSEIKAGVEKQVKAEFENSRISPFANRDWRKGIDLLFELIKFLN